MYDFSGGKESDISIITDKGKLSETVNQQVILDEKTSKQLSLKLGSKLSYGTGTASCFDPHLGFVYYLKGKVVAHVSVCLQCNRLRSSVTIPAQKQGKTGNGDEAYYLLDGMSDSFKQYLNNLVIKYKFSHPL
ncbi:hypothetical protein CLV94_3024 [Flavobacterium endophyticum]|uniref:Uncharacterized protein n=2 Tax=Flavobacterium endophyticum TaxID=1540163 RepID=A0A495M386_9FLAO|nr:hypothetical protein CLV94_3024 [Flavobacterium endophyticum]